ncbi:hypothetical protein C8J57DRAFT_1542015 [Mycena rebaudengoi]|nr:hypothetical protein C8J57DRAFT_1542015 [Mycena rebaudengoi]
MEIPVSPIPCQPTAAAVRISAARFAFIVGRLHLVQVSRPTSPLHLGDVAAPSKIIQSFSSPGPAAQRQTTSSYRCADDDAIFAFGALKNGGWHTASRPSSSSLPSNSSLTTPSTYASPPPGSSNSCVIPIWAKSRTPDIAQRRRTRVFAFILPRLATVLVFVADFGHIYAQTLLTPGPTTKRHPPAQSFFIETPRSHPTR